jgi:lipoprotein-releasing system ATP-binding protein
LADEPTGALDKENAGQVAELMLELNRQEKITLIVVTHSADLAGKMDVHFKLSEGVLQRG